MCSTFGGQLVTKPRHWYTPPSHASLEECQDGRRRAPSSELQEKAPRSCAEHVSQQHFYFPDPALVSPRSMAGFSGGHQQPLFSPGPVEVQQTAWHVESAQVGSPVP